jgi:hypothetical protein
MKKKVLCLLMMVLATTSVLKAQIYVDSAAIENAWYQSSYVFEGVVQSKCFFNDSNGIIYASNTVQISKVFKGNLPCGTVNIITLGGQFQGHILTVDHTDEFQPGMAGVFACNNSVYPTENFNCQPASDTTLLMMTYSYQVYSISF